MKKFGFAVMAAMTLLCFASCEKEKQMNGKWVISALYMNGVNYLTDEFLGGMDQEEVECIRATYLEFTDESVYLHTCGEAVGGTYTLVDDVCEIHFDDEEGGVKFVGTVDGDEYTVDGGLSGMSPGSGGMQAQIVFKRQ